MMRRILFLSGLILVGCSDETGPTYRPTVSGLAPAMYAGARVALVLDPLPGGRDSVVVLVAGAAVVTTVTDSGVQFTVPDSLDGAVEIGLRVDGAIRWADTFQVAGFVEQHEATSWIGWESWNLTTIEHGAATDVWGAVAGGRLARLTPSTGFVASFDTLLDYFILRSPGPTTVPGLWVVAPPAAVALDSLEIWQFYPYPAKVQRIPRMGIERQVAQLGSTVWLLTAHHGVRTIDGATDSVLYSSLNGYEEAQVLFRSPGGDRTTFTFHGGSQGMPFFGADGFPVFHLQGMRGPSGVAFTPDSARVIVVGYAQDYSGLLMEAVLGDGSRVDSIPLSYDPRAVALGQDGRVYVLGMAGSGRPFLEVYDRPGYHRLGRMQALAGTRACAFLCQDAIVAFDHLAGRVYVVDAADPAYAGAAANGIWGFRMLPATTPTTARVRLR
jgi:hypothetical protein